MNVHEEQIVRSLLHDQTKWVNGDAYRNWIQILLREVETLREITVGLTERVAAQSELLSRKAEKNGGPE